MPEKMLQTSLSKLDRRAESQRLWMSIMSEQGTIGEG